MSQEPSTPGHIPSWELPNAQTTSAPQTPPAAPAVPKPEEDVAYLPLGSTLRLYAGWLLAWYAAVYVLGSLQQSGVAPWAPEFIANLYVSPLTLLFTCATFLFLLLGTVQKVLGGGMLKGVALTAAGLLLFYGFWTFS